MKRRWKNMNAGKTVVENTLSDETHLHCGTVAGYIDFN
jgi:hypothetical protein